MVLCLLVPAYSLITKTTHWHEHLQVFPLHTCLKHRLTLVLIFQNFLDGGFAL